MPKFRIRKKKRPVPCFGCGKIIAPMQPVTYYKRSHDVIGEQPYCKVCIARKKDAISLDASDAEKVKQAAKSALDVKKHLKNLLGIGR